MNLLSPSVDGVAAIDHERVTDHEACRGAAKPKNRVGNFFGTTNAPDRNVLQHRLKRVSLTGGRHLIGHRRLDEAGTYGIDANAYRGIFQSGALGEPKHAVLGSVIGSAPGTADNASE